MRSRWLVQRLLCDLEPYNHIVVYGCGDRAKDLIVLLIGEGKTVDQCVVSHIENVKDRKALEGIPVNEVSAVQEVLMKKDTVVLIAAGDQAELEISRYLDTIGCANYLYRSKYDRISSSNLRVLECASDKERIQQINEWCDEWGLEHVSIGNKRKKKETTKNHRISKVLFIVGEVSPRVIKILGAIPTAVDYKVLVTTGCCGDVDGLLSQFECVLCGCVEELVYQCKLYQPDVVHLFTGWETDGMVDCICWMQQILPPLVYDKYDIMSKMYIGLEDRKEKEKYCLEHVSGICNRGFEIDYLIDEGYDIRCPHIVFMDYCRDGDDLIGGEDEECVKENDPIKLCYAGGIDKGGLGAICQIIENNNATLCFYTSLAGRNKISDTLDETDMDGSHIIIHDFIPYSKLKQEITKYDFGIVYQSGEPGTTEGYTNIKFKYAASNKFFDYLDAGLPIINDSIERYCDYFEKQGVLVRWNPEQYDFDELKRIKPGMKKRARQVRRELQIGRHIGELFSLYKDAISYYYREVYEMDNEEGIL